MFALMLHSRERKQKRAEEAKNSAPPRTAAEATRQMLKRKSEGGQKKQQHMESDNSYKPAKHDDEPNEVHDSLLKNYHSDHKAAQDTVEGDDDTGGEYGDDYNYGNEDDCEFEFY
ncbi:hypothetical protein Taro_000761 [Colocasia esculenta]|uniref:Uncharacterized protein n=1 Tax=Colocasia esculenta TaxID=4460 RepID=A0A843TIL8_COLES|nr:hypothetical protein [Colocasia esculenta]